MTLVFASIGLWRDPEAADLFRDLLTIILAIAGIGIAAAGGLVYMFIDASVKRTTQDIKKEVMSAVDTARLRSMCLSHLSSGYSWWTSYQRSTASSDLEEAIRETEFAYSSYAIHLDEKQSDNQLIICAVRNNLAYYYAERQRPEDRNLAREYAEYIRKKIPTHPLKRVTWEHTYNYVLQRYP